MEKNKIDANLYNEKSLYLLNIRELRDMGRKFGVPSPTTMKKRDLVDYILKVVYGEVRPPIRNACGRPNKREFDMSKYIDKIKKNTDLTEELIGARLSYEGDYKGLTFKVAAPKDVSLVGKIEQRVVCKIENKCFLRIRQFIESDSDYEIDVALANRLNLENFDVVEVVLTDVGIKIISVNGQKIANKLKEFEIEHEKIMAGSRKVFHIRTKEEIEKNIELIKETCARQGLRLVTFGENKLDYAENYELFETDNVLRFKKFMTFVEYIKKLVYENQDVVVVVQEMAQVEDILNSLEEEVSERMQVNLNNDINNFVKLGNVLLTFHHIKSVKY